MAGVSDLYDNDILAWSEAQADRLRRVAAGERVNDVDWEHVIEEVEAVGRSILKSARSLLGLAIEHVLKAKAMPEHQDVEHWLREADHFLTSAQEFYEPSMEQHMRFDRLWRQARAKVLAGYRLPAAALPDTVPAVDLPALLDPDNLHARDMLRRLTG
jgi:Domain of unknown function DUF29